MEQLPVLVVMGVSGSGKSTVAGIVAGRLGWDLEEGDDLHPPASVAKMASGIPLTDADRWPWLDLVGAWIREHTATGRPGVVTCSALRRVYRDRLRGDGVVFVYLAGDQGADRAAARRPHRPLHALRAAGLAVRHPGTPRVGREHVAGRARTDAADSPRRSSAGCGCRPAPADRNHRGRSPVQPNAATTGPGGSPDRV